MSKFADLADECFPIRPAPFELARIFAPWRPASGHVSDLDLPPPGDFKHAPWNVANSRTNRIDLADNAACKHRRIWGHAIRIEETSAENTRTPFRVAVLFRIPFRADGHSVKTAIRLYNLFQYYRSYIFVTDPRAVLV